MRTPILDFLQRYQEDRVVRFHMPGHKGKGILGCEAWDITEVSGADSLYEADGIIAESEANATQLFASQRTCYSTEGSSQCIRAMLYLAMNNRPEHSLPTIVAARNVHKAFIYAAALLGFEIVWLWPEESHSLCDCQITADALDAVLRDLPAPPAAVYLTSPNYLGGMTDLPAMAEVCHRRNTLLVVDNAHGAYLHFLPQSLHPLDLGADMCCDSAHKTLPVLTGGAYLHISKRLPAAYAQQAKDALALFGSTSPSYLTMASLDYCNHRLADDYPALLAQQVARLNNVRYTLRQNGWQVQDSDPLRITLCAPAHTTGAELSAALRTQGVECEYADHDFVVFMMTPENTSEELDRLVQVLGKNSGHTAPPVSLPLPRVKQACTVRDALFHPHETVPVRQSLGRICGSPTVSCPPAIPIAVSGELIGMDAITLFEYYGVETVDVLK